MIQFDYSQGNFRDSAEFVTYANLIRRVAILESFSPKVIGFWMEKVPNIFTNSDLIQTDMLSVYSILTDLEFINKDLKENEVTKIEIRDGRAISLTNNKVKLSGEDIKIYEPLVENTVMYVYVGNFCGFRKEEDNRNLLISDNTDAIAISSNHGHKDVNFTYDEHKGILNMSLEDYRKVINIIENKLEIIKKKS